MPDIDKPWEVYQQQASGTPAPTPSNPAPTPNLSSGVSLDEPWKFYQSASSPVSNPSNTMGGEIGGENPASPNPLESGEPSINEPWKAYQNPNQETKTPPTTDGYLNEPWYQNVWSWLNKPLMDFHREGAGGFESGAEDVISGLTSPMSIILTTATLGSGAIEDVLGQIGITAAKMPQAAKAVQLLTTGAKLGFTGQQVYGAMQSSSQMFDAIKEGDYPTAERLMVNAAAGWGAAILGSNQLREDQMINNLPLKILKPMEHDPLLDNIIGKGNADSGVDNQNINKLESDLREEFKNLPDSSEDKLNAVFRLMEHGRNKIKSAAKMANKSDLVSDETKSAYNQAVELPKEYNSFAQKLQDLFNENYSKAEESGLATKFLNEFTSYLWKDKPADAKVIEEQSKIGGIDQRSASAKSRVYLKALNGELEGKELAETDPIKVAINQRRKLFKEIRQREVLEGIKNSTSLAPDGRPLAVLSGEGQMIGEEDPSLIINPKQISSRVIPEKILKNPVLQETLQDRLDDGSIFKVTNAKGKDTYYWSGKGYQVREHPLFHDWKHIDNIDGTNVLVKSDLRLHPDYADEIMRRLGIDESPFRKGNLKNAIKASSAVKGTVFAINPMHYVNEALSTLMTRGNPFRMPSVDIAGNPLLYKLVQHGLRFSSSMDSLGKFIQEGVGASQEESNFFKGVPVLGKLTKQSHDFLWKYVDSQKAQAGLNLYKRYRSAFPELSNEEVLTKVADDVNNRFGSLDWTKLGAGKSMQDAMRLSLLAPDWFTARLRLGLSALGKQGGIVRQDMATMGAGIILGARVVNMLVSGQPHWETPFGVVIPRKDQDDVILSLRTPMSDLYKVMHDPVQALNNRLNPATTRIVLEALTHRDTYNQPRTIPQEVKDALVGMMPTWASSILNRHDMDLPKMDRFLDGAAKMALDTSRYRTEAEKLALQYAYNSHAGMPLTNQELDHHVLKMQISDALRGKTITPQQASTMLNRKDLLEVMKTLNKTPLQHYFGELPMEQALDVWRLALPAEKQQIAQAMWTKRLNWTKTHTSAEDRRSQTYKELQEMMPDLIGSVRAKHPSE